MLSSTLAFTFWQKFTAAEDNGPSETVMAHYIQELTTRGEGCESAHTARKYNT